MLRKGLFLYGFGFHEGSYLAELDVEDEGLVGADGLRTTLAVCQLGGDEELDLATFTNILHTFGPALNNTVQSETNGVGFGLNFVEHGAVEKGALVAYPNGILVGCGNELATGFYNKILKSAFGDHHACLLGILGEELLTCFLVGKELFLATVLKIVVEEIVHLVRVDAELLAEFRIAGVALGLDEGAHALLDLAVVEIAKIVTLDEGTEVHTNEVCDAVLGGLGDLEILGSLGYGSDFFDGGDFFALCGLCYSLSYSASHPST